MFTLFDARTGMSIIMTFCPSHLYRGADKSLARLWKEISYGDQTYKTYGVCTP